MTTSFNIHEAMASRLSDDISPAAVVAVLGHPVARLSDLMLVDPALREELGQRLEYFDLVVLCFEHAFGGIDAARAAMTELNWRDGKTVIDLLEAADTSDKLLDEVTRIRNEAGTQAARQAGRKARAAHWSRRLMNSILFSS